jgi:sirohydrochlorin ferrochelatase
MEKGKGRREKGRATRAAVAALAALLTAPMLAAETGRARTGVLLLAHGGSEQWNNNVRALAERVNVDRPVEVAFGMATRANIQSAVDALIQRGVTEIVAVPLFVSSHSSVVTSTEYLLGLRAEAPKELAALAKMNHGSGHRAGAAASNASHAHGHDSTAASAVDGTRPVTSSVPIRMTRALDSHPLVGSILADRARAISTDPAREAVILVAHGPVSDAENQKWLAELATLGKAVGASAPYATIDFLTVRDDAPAPIKNAATAEFRDLVEKRRAAGARVLIVPVLLSFGGIEQGIKKRLDGLEYVMAPQAIMPDDRLAEWIRLQVAK